MRNDVLDFRQPSHGLCLAVVSIVAMLLVSCGAPNDVLAADTDCIASPEEYRASWERFQVRCVSPDLFVTVTDGPSLYLEGFWYAWANSNINLQVYLELNSLYGDPSKPGHNPVKLANGVKSYLGFPMKNTPTPDYKPENRFVVYTLPKGESPLVPRFETWFTLLEAELGLFYPATAQADLIQAYSAIPLGRDVVDVYSELTGCRQLSYPQMLNQGAFLAENDAGCKPEYTQARKVAGESPYDGGNSKDCFRKFFAQYTGERDAAAIRGILDLCQDVSPLNTGVGRGYNRNENPLVCKPLNDQAVQERYTGTEFILPNRPLSELPEGWIRNLAERVATQAELAAMNTLTTTLPATKEVAMNSVIALHWDAQAKLHDATEMTSLERNAITAMRYHLMLPTLARRLYYRILAGNHPRPATVASCERQSIAAFL